MLVHMSQEHRLGEERLVVLTRAAISVAARTNLEVERTVDPATKFLQRSQSLDRQSVQNTRRIPGLHFLCCIFISLEGCVVRAGGRSWSCSRALPAVV